MEACPLFGRAFFLQRHSCLFSGDDAKVIEKQMLIGMIVQSKTHCVSSLALITK